jgi:hypothetical protein
MWNKPSKDAAKSRTRSPHPPYDQAVRATLESGDRNEIEQLLQGAKNLRAEHGSFEGLIKVLEATLSMKY